MAKIITPSELLSRSKEMVQDIRAYSKSQKDLWRRIPFLAIKAQGHDGNYHYNKIFSTGYMGLRPSFNERSRGEGHYKVVVDLATGNLLDGFDIDLGFVRSAKPGDLLALLANLDCLDAQRHVKEFEKKAIINKSRMSFVHEMAETYGVDELYVRRKTVEQEA